MLELGLAAIKCSQIITCELNLICSAYFVSAFENWLLLTVMGWAVLTGWNAQKKARHLQLPE